MALIWSTGLNFTQTSFYNNLVHGAGGAVAVTDNFVIKSKISQSKPSISFHNANPSIPIEMDQCQFVENKAVSIVPPSRARVRRECMGEGER